LATTTTITNPYDNFTNAALTDELTLRLSSKLDCTLDVANNNHLILSHPYLEQAKRLIYRIRVYKEPPEFVIHEKDIPYALVKHLSFISEFEMNEIVTESVRRLYECVAYDYFHTNGLYGLVTWRFEE
jgi:hypothetical protein